MENFKILARVYPSEQGFTAVVSALPEKTNALAEVRSYACDSREEGLTLLDPMMESLRLELTVRGDSVVGVEVQ